MIRCIKALQRELKVGNLAEIVVQQHMYHHHLLPAPPPVRNWHFLGPKIGEKCFNAKIICICWEAKLIIE